MNNLKDYPAALITMPQQSENVVIFMNDNSRNRYILNLIKTHDPELTEITKDKLDKFMTDKNIKLAFRTVECEKNLGKPTWPIGYACPKCDTLEIEHNAKLTWSLEKQTWTISQIKDNAYCPDCSCDILAKDVFLPVEIHT